MHHVAQIAGLSEVGVAVIALALCGALGLLFGAVKIRGVGLGIGGVLFAGLFVGHVSAKLGLAFDAATLEFVREFGLILFVYTIGVQVGPGFFASLQQTGLRLNLIVIGVVSLGVAMTILVHVLFDVEVPVLVGLMSGAVTNTPGLGAATQALKESGAAAEALAQPSLGYAVAYPFGILGILVTMMLIRFILRIDIDAEAKRFDAARSVGDAALPSADIVITNPNLNGLALGEVPGLSHEEVAVSRMRKDGALITPSRDVRVSVGDALHLVGPENKLREMRLILGEPADAPLTTRGTDIAWERIVVTEKHVLGRRIGSLGMIEGHGVRISRVNRAGAELVARGSLALQFGDIVTAVGPKTELSFVRKTLGGDKGRLDQVDFAALFFGIALGVLLGAAPIFMPGLPAPLKLGLAGGPLIVAIALARLGHLGPFVFFMPPVANHALRELGVVLFLAVVGLRAGDKFLETLLVGDGLVWMAYGAIITLAPLVIMGFLARLLMRIDYLTLCGVLAGSMTDPPALAFANSLSTSSAPALGYATVYPLVMCMRILAPQILVLTLL